MVAEEKMYRPVEKWLNYYYLGGKHSLEVMHRANIRYGDLGAQIDVLGIKYKVFKDEDPRERQLTDLFVVECKNEPWTYGGYGQLLYYKTILELYRQSKHWKCFNEDFRDGPKRFFDQNEKLPNWWGHYTRGNGKFVEFLKKKVRVHFYLALYRPRQYDERDWEDAISTAKNILSAIGGGFSVGLLNVKTDLSKCGLIGDEPHPLILSSKRQVPERLFFQAEEARLIPRHKTYLYCRWFDDEGKCSISCRLSKGQKPSPQNCRHCLLFRKMR